VKAFVLRDGREPHEVFFDEEEPPLFHEMVELQAPAVLLSEEEAAAARPAQKTLSLCRVLGYLPRFGAVWLYVERSKLPLSTEAQLLVELVDGVREMRRLQRAWFGGDKSPETLQASKAAERRIDAFLARLAAKPTHQPKLF
jgi:hypothetical protein